VLAIEPCPRVLPQLRKTVATLSNVTLIEAALFDSIGSATLAVPPDASMASLLQKRGRQAAAADYLVATTTLDHVLAATGIDAVDFVKCDVEGVEALVLRGARHLLDRRQAPTILFENNPPALRAAGQSTDTVAAWLASLSSARYRLYSTGRGGLEPLETIPEAFANILAVPEARRGAL
jgi:FkbM family methyltransferase